MSDTESSGILLQTPDGTPVRLTIMDEHDDFLTCIGELQEGVYGYESKDTAVTVFLEQP